MSFPNNLLSNSTWRRLGLGTSTLVLGLGVLSMVAPATTGSSLGVTSLSTSEGLAMNIKAMQFPGIRDIAAGGALLWFHRERNQKAMGVLLTSWVLVCVTDTWIAAQGPRGFDSGIWGLVGGGVVMAFVGLGLVQS
jgi:hypothetical protein